MIREETLYQATIANQELYHSQRVAKFFRDFRSVFPTFIFIELQFVTNQYIGF